MSTQKLEFAVAQLGARMHYAVPQMLHEADMLAHFFTDICAVKGLPRLSRFAPEYLIPGGMKRLAGRVPVGVPRERITAFTALGWEYANRRRKARAPEEATQAHLWAGQTLCKHALSRGLGSAGGVYTFDGAGLELLNYAKAQGLRAVMEQTIASRPVRDRLLREESKRFPDWEPAPVTSQIDSRMAEREMMEWTAADKVLCGSEFVKQSIAECGGPIERCEVVPYGVDQRFALTRGDRRPGLLRVLIVGTVGLRKGSPYVVEVAKRSKAFAVFRMVGSINVLPAAEQQLRRDIELTGPVPRSQIFSHYAWADVFLLPSICEGSATVAYEAMAASLPVVCTRNTGSVIKNEVDGFIVPIRDTDVTIECLKRLAEDPDLLRQMAHIASQRAKEYCSLEAYSQRLITAVTCSTT